MSAAAPPAASAARTLRRLAAWAVVAVPALWGVAQTVAKVGALFR